MELKRLLLWLMLALLSLFLFTGCGDLEPEMQDTRTVILKMDLHEKSSSRTSQVSATDIAAYQTHLILALPYWNWEFIEEFPTSTYKEFYYMSHAHKLMDPQSREVEMEIPLNTDMKIFAFLFSGKYSESELIMWDLEVGYYGESRSFTIGKQTDSLELGIRLIQATTNTGTDTSAPTVTFRPPDGATEVPISSNITITFDEAVRNTDDTPLTDSNIDSLITLNDASGADIDFDATIDTNKKVITIDPTYYFTYSQTVYVAIGSTMEDSSGNSITASYATFTTVQNITTTTPTVTFSPPDGATEVPISSNITITFDEAMRNTDDTPLTDSNIDSLITLNDANGNDIAFDATIDANKKVITIDPTYYFTYSQTVYVAISASVKDSSGNPITASSATFTAVQYLQY